jgi:succinylglutamate desuccinylase
MIQVQIRQTDRLIDSIGNSTALSIICVAAMHGNEQAGVIAFRNLIEKMKEASVYPNGRLIGLIANKKASEQNTRYLSYDLNRLWRRRYIKQSEQHYNEFGELHDLKESIDEIIAQSENTVILDLHTMSSKGTPFLCFLNTKLNRKLVYSLPTTSILGLVQRLEGTMIGYYSKRRGIPALCYEGGQHEQANSTLNIESFIWEVCKQTNLITEDQYLEIKQSKLNEDPHGHFVEVKYRHTIKKGDSFEMRKGFRNLSRVKKGQFLAKHNGKNIYAHFSGRIVLPLYQSKGTDGFFLAKESIKLKFRLLDLFKR